MFIYSQSDLATWGADLPGSPVLALSDDHEHLTVFAIGVQRLVRRNRKSLSQAARQQPVQKVDKIRRRHR
jgi:hypothetical protein